MGTQQRAQPGAAEFHIVVKRPSRTGPLAPYRFAICVLVAILISVDDLRAMLAGVPADASVLTRAVSVGVFTWVVLTILNRILAHGLDDEPVPAETGASGLSPSDTNPRAA